MSHGIAVVIPAYNGERWIGDALRSLAAQTLHPAEVVVVDDGSSDATASIAAQHGAKVLRQDRRGPGAARNRGIAETTAPLVAFLDADDWFAPGKLEAQVRALLDTTAPAVCCDAFVVDGDVVGPAKNKDRGVPEQLDFDTLFDGNPVICSTVLARRDEVLAVGGFDEDPVLVATEDYDLWLRLAARAPLRYLAAPMAYYRRHGLGLSVNARFLRGGDRILDKWQGERGGDGDFAQRIRRRRAGVRLDHAWDLMQAPGHEAEARKWIREAQQLAFSWKGLRMWAKSHLRASSR